MPLTPSQKSNLSKRSTIIRKTDPTAKVTDAYNQITKKYENYIETASKIQKESPESASTAIKDLDTEFFTEAGRIIRLYQNGRGRYTLTNPMTQSRNENSEQSNTRDIICSDNMESSWKIGKPEDQEESKESK